MDTQKEIKLRKLIEDFGQVELTIVDNNGKSHEEIVTNFEEAKQHIESLSISNEVFF